MKEKQQPEQTHTWLSSYLQDCAHELAVKSTVAVVFAIIASLAQWQFDWIGKAHTAIGEWQTTVKPEPKR